MRTDTYDNRSMRGNRGMSMRGGGSTRIGGLLGVVVIAWLIIGAIAGGQRHYYNSAPTNCASTSTIAETIVAGPLNYTGVNPKVNNCHVNVPLPHPSP